MDFDAPPQFQDDVPTEVAPDLELPSYSRDVPASWDIPPVETNHVYHLSKRTGEQWLIVTLKSRARDPAETPLFFQGGLIAGSVRAEFEKEEHIDSISATITGQMTIYNHSSSGFLNMRKILYPPLQESLEPVPLRPFRHAEKLKGHHEWPFTFILPKGVSILTHIVSDAIRRNFRLPPSIDDDVNSLHIQYQLEIRVARGGFRASNKKLTVPFLFMPMLRPKPPPITRQLAYQTGCPLIGADGDPHSWRTLPPATVRGTVFNSRVVDLTCTLSLARPLCYTRGSPLHLAIIIKSTDLQALDLVATPRSIIVCLVKRTTSSPNQKLAGMNSNMSTVLTMRKQVMTMANWWPSTESDFDQHAGRKTFSGEITVPEELYPGCKILNFEQEYAVEMHPFVAAAFNAEGGTNPIASQNVEIATAYASGPRPKSFMPPDYAVHDALSAQVLD